MKEKFKKFSQTIVGLTVILAMTLIVSAFTGPSQAQPGGNVYAPMNTSGTTQTKTGKLNFTWFEDYDQPGYYADPGGNSWLYRLYSYDIRSDIFYDRNNTSYYVDPASSSRVNEVQADRVYGFSDIRSPIFYDYNNTSYYIDPNSTSRMNVVNADAVYNPTYAP
ncbi:MAG: hypothetical protein AAB527_03930 [Patescibacteria group bacterium]